VVLRQIRGRADEQATHPTVVGTRAMGLGWARGGMPRIMRAMQLNAYVADRRRRVFAELVAEKAPSEGSFDENALARARVNGAPQLGATRFEPHAVVLEFIYPAETGPSTILTVTLPVPERIVFLPVPSWVVESIWQGEIDGSYHFEGEAKELLAAFEQELDEDRNLPWFGPRRPKRRE
jgi:hypothetical protein